jgi:hypothetical protein
MLKAPEVCVHQIQRHLHGVELEMMAGGRFQHVEVNVGVFMSRKTNESQLAGLFGFEESFDCTVGRKNPVRVFESNDFVELHQVDVVGLEASQRLVDLFGRFLLRSAVHLGHKKRAVAIAVFERLAHADFTLSLVIIPTVVEKSDAAVNRSSYDSYALVCVADQAEVKAAHADGRYLLGGSPERAVRNITVTIAGLHTSMTLSGWPKFPLGEPLLIASAQGADVNSVVTV